ncbi:hypothetical protein GDO81_002407 [Engystomops pustulosus]|uniref:Uncharacterized protein n=1 Tax=Engystomops pustulosus TaxID=76066 RepID=A0AAV7DMY0_ENGPU|nr:hypothetical protein GDO81_002407 [Engystomops pustulosus]
MTAPSSAHHVEHRNILFIIRHQWLQLLVLTRTPYFLTWKRRMDHQSRLNCFCYTRHHSSTALCVDGSVHGAEAIIRNPMRSPVAVMYRAVCLGGVWHAMADMSAQDKPLEVLVTWDHSDWGMGFVYFLAIWETLEFRDSAPL